MKSHRFLGWMLVAGLAMAAALCALPAHATEDSKQFLEALRERGYYDVALDQLARMRNNPRVPEEFKKRIPYEEAVTLIRQSAADRDVNQKVKLLDAAREKLTAFIKSGADPSLAASAESQLGNVLVERARTLLNRAAQPKNAAQKDALAKEAQGLFAEAQSVFDASEEKISAIWKQLPPPGGNLTAEQRSERDQIREDLFHALLSTAQARYEASKAYPPGSAEAKKQLEAAATKFKDLTKRAANAGRFLLFRLTCQTYEGRCYLEMGDTAKALATLGELLAYGDEVQELAGLKAMAISMAMQAWTSDKEKKYEEAVQAGSEWLKNVRLADTRTTYGMAVRYYLAVALKHQAETTFKGEEGPKRKALAEARKQAKEVAGLTNEHQDEAKKLFQELAGLDDGEDAPVNTFAEALEQGKDALGVFEARQEQVRMASTPEEQANVPTFEQEGRDAREKASKLFQRALELAAPSTTTDDLNAVRLYMCYLAYYSGDYLDAAVLGDFLTRRYPTTAGARQGAKIALLSLMQQYQAATPENRASEKRRMEALAEFVGKRWAGEADADDAWMSLMVVATSEHDVPQMLAYLAKIPETSVKRGEAELKAGQALWINALTAMRKPEAERLPQAELDKLRHEALVMLEQGVDRTRKAGNASGVTFAIATGALSLAQIYIESNQGPKAVALLEDPQFGPITLVNAGAPVAAQGNFAAEANKAALRAYVLTQQLEKAEGVMNALEKSIPQDNVAQANQTLINIYRSLGRELEEQVRLLRLERRTDDLQKVSKGFEMFLDRIAAKEQGNTFSSLNWVAETFTRLGAGHDGEETIPPEVRGYFEKAAATDERILKQLAADPSFGNPEVAVPVKARLAKSLRNSGKPKEAITMLIDVLKVKPNLLDVQKEAAYTYQAWGKENPHYYQIAISGGKGQPSGSAGVLGDDANVIMGWNGLAARTQREPRFREIFYEAQFNSAKCKLLQAQTLKGKEKTAALEGAAGTLTLTARAHPDLGGGDWGKKYNDLLKEIQTAMGKEPTGLPVAKPAASSKETAGGAAK